MQRGLKLLLLAAIAGGAYFLQISGGDGPSRTSAGPGAAESEDPSSASSTEIETRSLPPARSTSAHADGDARVARALERQESGFMVRLQGQVERILADDTEGSQHQRFIVRLASGQTILVAHNLDLAARVPLQLHDEVEIYGQYEFSDRGGTVHWTHHDPGLRREGGWIDHAGIRYR